MPGTHAGKMSEAERGENQSFILTAQRSTRRSGESNRLQHLCCQFDWLCHRQNSLLTCTILNLAGYFFSLRSLAFPPLCSSHTVGTNGRFHFANSLVCVPGARLAWPGLSWWAVLPAGALCAAGCLHHISPPALRPSGSPLVRQKSAGGLSAGQTVF